MNSAIVVLILLLIFEIVYTIGQLEVFHKAGYKWWIGFIPVYSTWILVTKIAKMAPFWFVIDSIVFVLPYFADSLTSKTIIYFVDLFSTFCICYNIAKTFNKKPILNGIIGTFFTGIWLSCLGFDKKSQYNKNAIVSPNGPFGS